ncbi:hypothetical protein OROHE_014257 [Orobanche hederae]
MARPTFLLALAATFLSLAAFSATARSPSNHHKPAPAHSTHPHSHRQTHCTPPAPPLPPANEEGDALPPEPYPGFYGLVEGCMQKISGQCGQEIFRGIFEIDGDEVISDDCCGELVAMGRRCHRKILKATMMLPEVSKKDRKKIKMRDANIWNHCIAIP